MDTTRRLTGCLSRTDAERQWHEMAATFTALRLPERVACRKWGRGWALFAVPADDARTNSGQSSAA
ncbi:hypothetical protein GCM10027168_01960 [Streptomyces capparidis]